MADSSESVFLCLYIKNRAIAPVDYLSTFATAPLLFSGYDKTRIPEF